MMNKTQLAWMWTGIGVVSLMVLFPPWLGRKGNGPLVSIGWHPIHKHPTYKSDSSQTQKSYAVAPDGTRTLTSEQTYYPRRDYYESRVNYPLLGCQVMLVLLITIAAILTDASKSARQQQQIAAASVNPNRDQGS